MKKIIVGIIRIYQMIPFSSHYLCRFTPTCSEYTIEAINEYGLIKGLKMGFKRISKCHPGGEFGYDPIIKKEKL